jgi:hypothetical protein
VATSDEIVAVDKGVDEGVDQVSAVEGAAKAVAIVGSEIEIVFVLAVVTPTTLVVVNDTFVVDGVEGVVLVDVVTTYFNHSEGTSLRS